MSSLAAARAGAFLRPLLFSRSPRLCLASLTRRFASDNFYYPPDWTPESGSLNAFAGAPPGNLGKRAKKLDQGILVIRCVWPRRLRLQHGSVGSEALRVFACVARATWGREGAGKRVSVHTQTQTLVSLRACACALTTARTPRAARRSFEMPFNVWCTGCRHLIAKGTPCACSHAHAHILVTTRLMTPLCAPQAFASTRRSVPWASTTAPRYGRSP
jgi:hypothetical protein